MVLFVHTCVGVGGHIGPERELGLHHGGQDGNPGRGPGRRRPLHRHRRLGRPAGGSVLVSVRL